MSGLINDIAELFGRTLLCDCPPEKPCIVDILIAMVYSSIQDEADAKTRAVVVSGKGAPTKRGWSSKALGFLVASSVDIAGVLLASLGFPARHPLVRLDEQLKIPSEECRWPQEAIIGAFVRLYPDGLFLQRLLNMSKS